MSSVSLDGDECPMGLNCLMINLDRSADRLRTAHERFTAAGLPFQRIRAVDGRLLNPSALRSVAEEAVLANMGRSMLAGEIAACMSHALALRTFLDTTHSSCLIVEDDALPRAGASCFIEHAVQFLDRHRGDRWNVLHCGDVRLRIRSRIRGWPTVPDAPPLYHAHYFPMGAYALCWSRSGAERFLKAHDRITAPFDNQVQNWLCRSGGGFAFSPGLFSVTDASSDIDGTAAWTKPMRGRVGRVRGRAIAKQRRLWTNRAAALLGLLRTIR